jgi:DNA-binding CsgD family transcriptional regulator
VTDLYLELTVESGCRDIMRELPQPEIPPAQVAPATRILLGRGSELAAIQALCGRSRDEQSVIAVVIEGDPGSGKTRLLAEATSRLTIPLRVCAAGYEPERGLPLGVARDLMRVLAGSSSHVQKCLGPFTTMSAGGAAPDWSGFFEAASRAVSLSGPLAVVVDDLQWADPQSIAMLHYLVRAAEASGEQLCLIFASRPSATLSALCSSLSRVLADRFLRLELGALDDDAALALVRSANRLLDQGAAEKAAAVSGGSPFWCEFLALAGTDSIDLSRLVDTRLRGVSVQASALLATIAVLARPMHLREIGEVHSWDQERVRDVLSELTATGLVVQDGASVRTAHDLVRVAVSAWIPDSDRRSTHRIIASWLEGDAGEDAIQLLAAAQHRRSAGVGAAGTVERILHSPMRRSLGHDGLKSILELIDHVPADDPREPGLQWGAAALAAELGQHTVALQRWPRIAERPGAPATRAQAWLAACEAAQHLERPEQARAHLDEARKLAGDDVVLGLELNVAEASLLRWLEQRHHEARQASDRALAGARELASSTASSGQLALRIRTIYLQALVQTCVDAMQRNAPRDVLALADEISEVAAGLDMRSSVQARLRGGSALMMTGRFVQAEEQLAQAWVDARRSFLSDLTLEVGAWLVWTRYLVGQLDDAEEVAAECVALSTRIGEDTRPAAMAQLWSLTIELSRADHGAALAGLQALARGESDAHHRTAILQTIARWLARLADPASVGDVLSALHDGRRDADGAGCTRCRTEFLLVGSEALARTGSLAEAQDWLAEGRRESDPGVFDEWLIERATASIAVAAGTSCAQDSLEHAILTADRLGMGLEAIWLRLDLGQLLSKTSTQRCHTVLKEAHAQALSAGAVTERRLAEQLLRRCGARSWQRGTTAVSAGGHSTLSPREQEITLLIRDGKSNLDIAQQLFLSRKTVERHVSNIFAKQGVKNRAQLAALSADTQRAWQPGSSTT